MISTLCLIKIICEQVGEEEKSAEETWEEHALRCVSVSVCLCLCLCVCACAHVC